MAMQIVDKNPESAGARYLPFDDIGRVDDLAYQAHAVLDVVRIASSASEEIPSESLAGACWVVQGMVREMKAIASKRVEG